MSTPLRVVTWNVHGSARPNSQDIAGVLARTKPDVVCLQEVRHPNAIEIAAALGWTEPAWAFKHNAYVWRHLAEGIAVLSRLPIVATRNAVLSESRPRTSYRRRVVLEATVQLATGVRIAVANTHLSTEPVDRAHQAERLIRFARSASIIAGDLNDDAAGPTLATLAAAGWTDPGPADPDWRVDFVLTPRGSTGTPVASPVPIPEIDALSDHRLIVVDVIPASA
jgi:endonuclease/exonuclease/phosphatase family metal-dependent hydrolase